MDSTTARRVGQLLRCPKCHCPQPWPADGRCRACKWSAPVGPWEESARLRPIQPEERNGHRCLECGGKVVVTVPIHGAALSPQFRWTVFGVCFGGLALLLGMQSGAFVLFAGPALLTLPLHVLYRRYRGHESLRVMVVKCPTCDFVRIDGSTEARATVHYRRGAATFDGIYRKVFVVFGFFLVTCIGTAALGHTPAWSASGILAVSIVLLFSIRWYRSAFGVRSWW